MSSDSNHVAMLTNVQGYSRQDGRGGGQQPPSLPPPPSTTNSNNQQKRVARTPRQDKSPHHHIRRDKLCSTQAGANHHAKSTSPPDTNNLNNAGLIPSQIPDEASNATCQVCNLPIQEQGVRALGSLYHWECFRCADCGKLVKEKFFPFEISSDDTGGRKKIPLCEKDYFGRLSLLCHVCHGALRGSYITALGRKYHIKHFSCSMCQTVFGPDDSYYEHNGEVYCHYHFSIHFADKCEGCQAAILTQFVEVYRNNREQQWHPECYMIHKYWNVRLACESSAAARLYSKDSSPTDLQRWEDDVEEKVYNIWTVLSSFEEVSAACISDMLQFASTARYADSVNATGRLIYRVDNIFGAIDALSGVKSLDSKLGREPKILCKKIVAFLSFLSKHSEKDPNRKIGITQDLLGIVTGLAHYFKLLIRFGLSNALKIEDADPASKAVSVFLDYIIEKSKSSYQDIPSVTGPLDPDADCCEFCHKGIEAACIKYGDRRWHIDCLECGICAKPLGSVYQTGCLWSEGRKQPICSMCTSKVTDAMEGFQYVTKLSQFVFLLKVALSRIAAIFSGAGSGQGKSPAHSPPSRNLAALLQSTTTTTTTGKSSLESTANPSASSSISDVSSSRPSLSANNSENYVATLNDIKRMKSTRMDQKVSTQARKIHRSKVAESAGDGVDDVNMSSSCSSSPSKQSSVNEPHLGPQTILNTSSVSIKSTSRPSREIPQQQQRHQFYSPVSNSNNVSIRENYNRQFNGDVAKNMANDPNAAAKVMSAADNNNHQPANEADSPVDEETVKSVCLERAERSLSLDDIPRIAGAEQVRQQKRYSRMRHEMIAEEQRSRSPTTQEVLHPGTDRPKPAIPTYGSDPKLGRRYYSELSVFDLFIARHLAVLALHPLVSEWFTLEELFDLIEVKKNVSFWGRFGKAFGVGGGEKRDGGGSSGGSSSGGGKKRREAVFGVLLDVLIKDRAQNSSLGIGPVQLQIPTFVDDCISAMKQKDMSVEGVFRKNGNIKRLKALSESIDKSADGRFEELAEESPVQLAALLKKFLRDLPDPLLTFKLYKLWTVCQKIEDEEVIQRVLHLTCCLMPKSHRDLMEILFDFLNWVASFAHVDEESGSKMDLYNIATVVAPNILYPKSKDGSKDFSTNYESSDSYFLAIETVYLLLKYNEEFCEVPTDINRLLHDPRLFEVSTEITTKDIVSLYSSIVSENNNAALIQPGSQANGYGGIVNWEGGQQQQHNPQFSPVSSNANSSSQNDSKDTTRLQR